MMDEPLDSPVATDPGSDRPAPAALPGYAPLTPLQNTALWHAARLSMARALAQLEARHASTPPGSDEVDVSAIAITALEPLRHVCMTLPPESAQLIGVLVGHVMLVEALRAVHPSLAGGPEKLPCAHSGA